MLTFKELLNNQSSMESINTASADELRKLRNSAASVISRAATLDKKEKAQDIREAINKRLRELEDTKPQATWKNKDINELTYDEAFKATKQAQWYKHMYSPERCAHWKYTIEHTDDPDVIAQGKKFLKEAPAIYEQALLDEAKYKAIRDGLKPKSPSSNKIDEIEQLVTELSDKKLSKNASSILEAIKKILE